MTPGHLFPSGYWNSTALMFFAESRRPQACFSKPAQYSDLLPQDRPRSSKLWYLSPARLLELFPGDQDAPIVSTGSVRMSEDAGHVILRSHFEYNAVRVSYQ